MNNKYDHQNIATMEMIYGEGYLSAGGDGEVTAIINGINLTGKEVLDIGCGLGGATISLARDHDASHVVGIDIDKVVLDRAVGLVAKAQLGNKATITQVEPGPLPFDDHKFDLAYITAVTCHLQDVKSFFNDAFRVLKPGGMVAGCEWFKIDENQAFQKWDKLLRDRGLNFYFVETGFFKSTLGSCGYEDVSITDRTPIMTELATNAVDRVDNELKEDLIDVLGHDGYESCRDWTAIRANALTNGGMGQSHFRASRPK